ncbi:hypothetical protein DUNSADRAFT_7320 [Dunaliella salina]|uniref:Encoded protein n=1 Tax=Dunaliella salina TaxID=3046 RepID=A0ABQ7GLI7_DUNSA|nr:hypothetical protein DUNSADRAFT_7320 [Dunaliella salina]|eukprot:KAF5835480.1 hypothetical protein DUNSADRAFT_7320 [Dunaliella salina]
MTKGPPLIYSLVAVTTCPWLCYRLPSHGPHVQAGACSTDILKALAGSEQAKGGGPGQDRLGALASHVLGQRSFFPVYPAPPGTCLDLSSASFLTPACTPHLLLLASDLAPFAKMVAPQPPHPCSQQHQPPNAQSPQQPLHSPAQQQSPEQQHQQQQPLQQPFVKSAPAQVVCVNPGRLAKGGTGGTFAHVHVHSGQRPVPERCRVEIVRI